MAELPEVRINTTPLSSGPEHHRKPVAGLPRNPTSQTVDGSQL